MRNIKLVIISVLYIFAENLYASGWSGEVVIEEIYALNETESIIKLSNFTNPDECQVTSAGHVIINPSVNKAWFSMLLTAYAAKSKVIFLLPVVLLCGRIPPSLRSVISN